MNLKKLLFVILIFVMISLLNACASKKNVYKISLSKVIPKKQKVISKNKIDAYKTYEVYFKLKQFEKCINVSFKTSYVVDTFSNKKRFSRTYFIVEKAIDVSKFKKSKKRYEFSPLGKNYSDTWRNSSSLTICSKQDDPLLKLDNKTFYRIRYTTFSKYEYSFQSKVLVKANVPVEFITKP